MSAFQNSNHTPFTPTFDAVRGRIARYTCNHAIAVHGCSDILRGDKNVRLARFFRREKAVAGRMNRQFSSYEIRLGGKNISVLADACDLARALELTQYFPQCNPLAGGQVKFATDVDLVKRPVIFPRHERQNLFSNITSVCGHLGETIWSGLSS